MMKRFIQAVSLSAILSTVIVIQNFPVTNLLADLQPGTPASPQTEGTEGVVDAHPKLVRISGKIDGSGRIKFTAGKIQYEHKHWGRPNQMTFDGEPWAELDRTPLPWTDYSHRLDLTKATVVKRVGRDSVALESTPDGFDLYLCDSPNGAGQYEVVIAIPRRN